MPLYAPLDHHDSIRVLHIDEGEYDDPIVTQLKQVNLADDPQYIALSYVWGDPTPSIPIMCNGQPFSIGINLAKALRRLRERFKGDFWVDALCIDQQKIEERNCQVRIMGLIYRKAKRVAAYLGERTNDTDEAVQLLSGMAYMEDIATADSFENARRIMAKYDMILELNTGPELVEQLMQNEQSLLSRTTEPIKEDFAEWWRGMETELMKSYWQDGSHLLPVRWSSQWDALQNFFRLDYFSRVWIIQEVACATEDPIIIVGSMGIPWQHVANAAYFYRRLGIPEKRPRKDLYFHILCIDNLRQPVSSNAGYDDRTLLQLLRHTVRFRATDPRDKVFALLTLASDTGTDNNGLLLQSDYNMTVEEVFCRVAKDILIHGNVGVLSFASNPSEKNIRNLPTWIPDWTSLANEREGINPLGTGLGLNGYNPCLGLSGSCWLSYDANILGLPGALIDRVSWTSEKFTNADFGGLPEFRNPGKLRVVWEEHVKPLGEKYQAGGTVLEAFWRSLIANVGEQRKTAGDEYFIHFLSMWRGIRLADFRAEQNLRQNLERPEFVDNDIRAASERDKILGIFNQDELNAIKRRYSRQIEQYTGPCVAASASNDINQSKGSPIPRQVSECVHCQLLHDSSLYQKIFQGCTPMQGDDPTLEMMDDEIIAEWYKRLRTDDTDPIHVLDAKIDGAWEAMIFALSQRKFLVTSSGLVGIGPADCSAGDFIAIAVGSEVPLVLRCQAAEPLVSEIGLILEEIRKPALGPNDVVPYLQIEDSDELKFSMVGEAYVHGIMDGRYVPLDPQGRPQWSELRLV